MNKDVASAPPVRCVKRPFLSCASSYQRCVTLKLREAGAIPKRSVPCWSPVVMVGSPNWFCGMNTPRPMRPYVSTA